jgi:hypothetical protein
MRPNRLQNALTARGDAMREVNAAIEKCGRNTIRWRHTFSSRAAFAKTSPAPKAAYSPFVGPAQLAAGV